ncbi:protein PHYTOCHROME KINASE SUBSTRATE 1-like [Andrographis paniculata]|uniref:protein PHYTOCHROME KINASE SUBSTRATE 1-like n=1 Tax=Andrographis paniculata TaxID=175694 RepID=UPI0021E880D3|nr:protein PHYTOCHROME KINASE SUBSTRATE 1-like [Andrographis paniculata]
MSSPLITLASSSNPPYTSTTILRDPSFAAYLNGAEENFVLRLNGSTGTSVSIPLDTSEIDVVQTEKYFDENYDPDLKRDCERNPVDIATPSVHSESTWNSQAALLQKQPRSTKMIHFLARFGCGSSCRDKNSGSSSRNGTGNGKSGQGHQNNDVDFSFPGFNPKAGNQSMFSNSFIGAGTGQDGRSSRSSSMADSDSCASSDLFEIESLSPRNGYAPSSDFSVMSESEDVKSSRPPRQRKIGSFKPRWNVLSGCMNRKAVEIVGARATEVSNKASYS